MAEEKINSYKSILKVTQIIGTSQLIRILVSVVSTKFVALYLGAFGVGILGLINNMVAIISSVTSFGIGISGVKEVAKNYHGEIDNNFSKTIIVLQRWSLAVGFLGLLVCLLFSKQLSIWTFGHSDNYFWFVVLSVNFMFSAYAETRFAILRGMQRVKKVATAIVFSSILITSVSIFCYYFFGLKGIIPVIILSNLINCVVYYYHTRDIRLSSISVSSEEIKARIGDMVKLGFLLSINVIFGHVCNFIIRMYLQKYGTSPYDLGIFQAASVLLVTYVGLIFTTMGTDFFPSLTRVSSDNKKVKEVVNHQIEIALLLITPAILVLYFLAPIVVKLLYTKEFFDIILILKAGCFAVILKGITWPLAYIILSKSENKLYFFQELMSDLFAVIFGILFYKYYGLTGLGIATLLNYLLYGIYVYWLTNKKFDFEFTKETKLIAFASVFFGFLASVTLFVTDYPKAYGILGILSLLSIVFSMYQLNKRVSLKNYILSVIDKFRK